MGDIGQVKIYPFDVARFLSAKSGCFQIGDSSRPITSVHTMMYNLIHKSTVLRSQIHRKNNHTPITCNSLVIDCIVLRVLTRKLLNCESGSE